MEPNFPENWTMTVQRATGGRLHVEGCVGEQGGVFDIFTDITHEHPWYRSALHGIEQAEQNGKAVGVFDAPSK